MSFIRIHFHQDLVEDINVAGKGQRALAVVTILRFSFFEQHLEQGVVCVLGFDDKPLHLGSNIHREATFGGHDSTVFVLVLVFRPVTVWPWFASHGISISIEGIRTCLLAASSYGLASLPCFGYQPTTFLIPFSLLSTLHLINIIHLICSNKLYIYWYSLDNLEGKWKLERSMDVNPCRKPNKTWLYSLASLCYSLLFLRSSLRAVSWATKLKNQQESGYSKREGWFMVRSIQEAI